MIDKIIEEIEGNLEALKKTDIIVEADGEICMKSPLLSLPCGVTGLSITIFPIGIYIDCCNLPMFFKNGSFKELTIKIEAPASKI